MVVMPAIRNMRHKGKEKPCDAISFRVTSSQRRCLKQVSREYGIGLCEAARELLDAGIAAWGFMEP
jgi:hypothetical protein